jgi:hypothetical protein
LNGAVVDRVSQPQHRLWGDDLTDDMTAII